jgi:cytochrome c biogenesis protein CcmG, thiol:disulfide interchange protein DsbE
VRRLPVTAAAVAVLAVVGGCSAEPGPPTPVPGGAGDAAEASAVDVDSPALRRLKQATAVRPCPPSDPSRAPVDGGLPDITLPCLGGGRDVHLAGLRGKPTVVNLWASWCIPCREELPVLQEFYERADGRVRMLGVDFEDTRPAAALSLLQHTGVSYPQVADFSKAIDRAVGPHPVPTTVLVDASGRVVAKLPLQITSAGQLATFVRQSLGVRV